MIVSGTGWLSIDTFDVTAYDFSGNGAIAIGKLDIKIKTMRNLRRRFACARVDWSEMRPPIGGAFGVSLLDIARKRHCVIQDE